MSEKYTNLFTPFKIGKVEIKNRYCMAPMGGAPFTAMGAPDPDGIKHMVSRAKGGFGLLYTSSLGGDVSVDKLNPFEKIFPMYNPIEFKRVSIFMNERIHAYGAKCFCQVSIGPGRNGGVGKKAPSELPSFFDPKRTTEACTHDEIKQKIHDIVETSKLVKASGYDGMDIHAMHWGYLIDEFSMSITNQRTDEYGGSLENRLRVAREIVEGIKANCGADFPVTIRLGLKSYMEGLGKGSLTGENEAGRDIGECIEICKLLEKYGYDGISADVGTYESFYRACAPSYFPKCEYIDLAARVKKEVNIPVMLAGRMNDPEICEKAIADGEIDAVVIGRAALADPMYVKKVEMGKTEGIRPCLACNQACIDRIFTGGAVSCAVNPSVCREESYGLQKTLVPKKVAVIGGGVAGMEAARSAQLRGHDVTIYEASDKLGGNLIIAGAHSFKEPVLELNEWYIREIKEMGIPVKMNTKVDAAMVKKMDADAIILASGSVPLMPKIKGIEKAVSSNDFLIEKGEAGNNVVVIGGGLVGCEIALDCAMEGKDVTIVEALDTLMSAGGRVPLMNRMAIDAYFEHYNVKVCTSHRIEEVTDKGAVVSSLSGEKKEILASKVIMAIGFCSVPSIASELYETGKEIYEIGDGAKVGSILTAIWDAYEVAREL